MPLHLWKRLKGRAEHMGRLLFSDSPNVVLIMLYSDFRLAELGGEEELRAFRMAVESEPDQSSGCIRRSRNSSALAMTCG